MSNLRNILRDIGYFGVGAAAILIETGAKAGKALIRKGEKTLRDNQDTVDDLKRKAKDLGDKVKASVEKAVKPEQPPVDAAAMTPEERETLRRQLDEADAACSADTVCEADVTEPEEPACPTCECSPEDVCYTPADPVVPDAVYHTAEPVPSDKDEKTE